MPYEVLTYKAKSWAPGAQIEPQALQQIENLSLMPFIFKHVAVMPDVHFGKGAPIGTCIPTQGAVIPACVGRDIGCGMMACRVKLETPLRDLLAIREGIEAAVPVGAGGYNQTMTDSAEARVHRISTMAVRARKMDTYANIPENWNLQMGTLGSGNHFIEIVLDEKGRTWAFLHSGSRGFGNKIAVHYTSEAKRLMAQYFVDLFDPDLAYLPLGTPEFAGYMQHLAWAQEFAKLNREEMMDRVLAVLREAVGKVDVRETIQCHHNFTKWENHYGENVIVTRKGAIEARKDQLGLIPGSMGTASYVVRGKGCRESFNTAPHGAGRRMSRRQAHKTFTMEDFDRDMAGVEVRRSKSFLDELPGAYKDIDAVIEQSADLVDVVHTFRQVVNVKGE